MFVHPLTIIRTTYDDTPAARDDEGQPAATTSNVSTVGLIQPKTAREIEDSRSSGAEVSDHRIFLPMVDLASADSVMHDGRRYHITGVRQYDFGGLAHIEADARLVTSASTVIQGS